MGHCSPYSAPQKWKLTECSIRLLLKGAGNDRPATGDISYLAAT